MRHVTGKATRYPGPNPNASYQLRYTPPEDSDERRGGAAAAVSFAITGAHLDKTWSAYGERVEGRPPVWDPDFVSHKPRRVLPVGVDRVILLI